MKTQPLWRPGDRKWFKWFRLPIERLTYANALGSVYSFYRVYRPDGAKVAWFWSRKKAQALADKLNKECASAARAAGRE